MEIFKNRPQLQLLSKSKLYRVLKDEGINKKDIDDYFNPKEITQIYIKPKKKYNSKITAPPYSFQVDIALLPKYKKHNKGIDKFLIFTDILSRKAYIYPLKSGKMHDILDIYEYFFLIEVEEQVHSIAGDAFFNNKDFIAYNDEVGIEVFHDIAKDDHITKMGDKLAIVDRCIRTIKQLIQKYMLIHDTTKWINVIDEITNIYNDTPNSGIKNMTPNEVFDDYDYMEALYKNQKK
jgi:hypothetical protein